MGANSVDGMELASFEVSSQHLRSAVVLKQIQGACRHQCVRSTLEGRGLLY
jgi:hypothetical protein